MSADIRTIQDFIRNLLSATANASLYSPSHPQVSRLTEAAFASISQVLADLPELTIVVIEGELVINGQPQEFSLFLNRFAQIMKSRGISRLQIGSGLSRDEIGVLISGLAHTGEDSTVVSSEHVKLGQVSIRLGTGPDSNSGADSEADRAALSMPDMPQEEMTRFTEMYEAAKNHKKLKITGMFEIVSGFITAFRQEGDSMLAVASLRNTDEYTFTHSTNVCILNIAQATALGIEGQLLHDIGIAAMLHDIGKLFIPEEILTKNGQTDTKGVRYHEAAPVPGCQAPAGHPGRTTAGSNNRL